MVLWSLQRELKPCLQSPQYRAAVTVLLGPAASSPPLQFHGCTGRSDFAAFIPHVELVQSASVRTQHSPADTHLTRWIPDSPSSPTFYHRLGHGRALPPRTLTITPSPLLGTFLRPHPLLIRSLISEPRPFLPKRPTDASLAHMSHPPVLPTSTSRPSLCSATRLGTSVSMHCTPHLALMQHIPHPQRPG